MFNVMTNRQVRDLADRKVMVKAEPSGWEVFRAGRRIGFVWQEGYRNLAGHTRGGALSWDGFRTLYDAVTCIVDNV